jgi:predicted DNA-binding antitoxin AbrB/MazE fold protein
VSRGLCYNRQGDVNVALAIGLQVWALRESDRGLIVEQIHAIYENGVFRPLGPVQLPEHCHVEFEPRMLPSAAAPPGLDDVYAVLSRSFHSGEHDVAARHNDHQP